MTKKKQAPQPVTQAYQDIPHEVVTEKTVPTQPAEPQLFKTEEVKQPAPLVPINEDSARKLFEMSDELLAKQKEALATTINGIDDKAGYKVIYDAHQVIKNTLTDIEKVRIEQKRIWSIQPGKAIDAVAKKLEEDWKAQEVIAAEKRKVIDDEKARIAKEEADKKEKRQQERIILLNGWGFLYDFVTSSYMLDPEKNPLAITAEEVLDWEDEWTFFAGVAEQRYLANEEVKRQAEEAAAAAKAEAEKALNDANARAEAEKQRADDLQRQIDELKALIKPKEEEPKRTNLDLVAYGPRGEDAAEEVKETSYVQGPGVFSIPAGAVIKSLDEVPAGSIGVRENSDGSYTVKDGDTGSEQTFPSEQALAVSAAADEGVISFQSYSSYKKSEVKEPVESVAAEPEDTAAESIPFTPTPEQKEFLEGIVAGEGAETMEEAVGYCITAVMSIEARYDQDAYWMGDNDVRKPYIAALEEIFEGKPPKGKAFAVWARGIAQDLLKK